MVANIVDIGVVAAYLFILGVAAVQYRRGKLSSQRILLFIGASFMWLSYGILQLTQSGPIPTGTPLNYILDGFSIVLLLSGLYAMYRWWRSRENETENDSTSN